MQRSELQPDEETPAEVVSIENLWGCIKPVYMKVNLDSVRWTYQEVKNQEQIFLISNRRRCLSNGGQCQSGPVQTVNVASGQRAKLWVWNIGINPRVWAQSQDFGEAVVPTGIPVNDDQDIQDQFPDAEGVGITCTSFCSFE